MIAEKPMKANERVLKYAEFAAKFDVAEQLDIPGREMSVITFYNLDAQAFILAVIVLAFYVLYKVIFAAVFVIQKVLIWQSAKAKCD
jgi:hypothetical protein